MTKPLFSIPVVCDGGMDVTFSKHDVIVTNQHKEVVLRGYRDPYSSLWLIPSIEQKIAKMKQLKALNSVRQPPSAAHTSAYHQQTHPKLTAYLHACVSSLPPTTWIKAITNDWFSSWPG
eukprot:scaffold391142_cov47-Attheya_sp.AAC.4